MMVTVKGPEFSFAGIIPPDINVLSVEEARRQLAQHEAKCPGTYMECYAAGTLDARREWLDERDNILFRIELAEAYAGGVHVAIKVQSRRSPEERRSAPRSPNNSTRKTVEEYMQHLQVAIRELARLDPGSKEWNRVRSRATNYSLAVRRRAKEDGAECPELPDIPKLAAFYRIPQQHRTGRPRVLESTPALERRRDADRERKAAARKEAAHA